MKPGKKQLTPQQQQQLPLYTKGALTSLSMGARWNCTPPEPSSAGLVGHPGIMATHLEELTSAQPN